MPIYFSFSYIGLIISILVLAPFIAIWFLKPVNIPKEIKGQNVILTILTYLGLAGCIVFLCSAQEYFNTAKIVNSAWFWLVIVSFIGFVVFWVNYFFDRNFEKLLQGFGFVPMPIAFFTVLTMCFTSLFINHFWMWLATVVLGIGIIGNSLYIYFQVTKDEAAEQKKRRAEKKAKRMEAKQQKNKKINKVNER